MKQAEIDALARLLDRDPTDGEATDEARTLASLAQALEAAAPAAPRADFKADLRHQLVEAARAEAAAPTLLSRLRDAFNDSTARIRYSARMAAATGATAMALSSGGVALAAHRSLPSDPFYGVKLAAEDLRLAFVSDAVERGRLLLGYAQARLDEAELSATAGDMSAAERALREADESSRRGAEHIIRASQQRGDPALLDMLTEFSRNQRNDVQILLPLLSGDARTAAEEMLVVLARIDQRVAVLTGQCGECEVDPAAGPVDTDPSGRDFDLAVVPPASEPFAACPCVAEPDDGTDQPVADDGSEQPGRTGGDGQQPAAGSGDSPASGDQGGDTSDGGDTGGEDTGSGTLPRPPKTGDDTIDDAVEDAVDEVEDVVDDVIEDLPISPSPLPEVPIPTPSLDPGDILP